MSVLSMIANPAQADILGAMDKGRERQATDMAGEILGETMGGKIGALAKLSPDKAIALDKALGTQNEVRRNNMIGVSVMGSQMIEAGQIEEAIQFFGEEAEKVELLTGQPASRLKLIQEALRTGDQETVGNFMTFASAMDPTKQVSAKDEAQTNLYQAQADALSNKPAAPKRNTTTIGDKIIDTDTGDTIYNGGGTGITIPKSIIKGLPDEMAARVADVFVAAGGGKDGIKAAGEERVLVQEDMRRDNAYESLAISYPNVSPEEMTQLQTAIDTAPTVERGMSIAEGVRTNQRAAQKAAVMSDRSLELVNNILANDELQDVVGSSEGKFGGSGQPTGATPGIGGFISDKEAEAIADIEEITNILTVPAMNLMTGILSESDLKLLKTISGGAFNRTRGIERFKKDVGQIQTILNRASIIGKLPAGKHRDAAVWATNKVNFHTRQAKEIRNRLGL